MHINTMHTLVRNTFQLARSSKYAQLYHHVVRLVLASTSQQYAYILHTCMHSQNTCRYLLNVLLLQEYAYYAYQQLQQYLQSRNFFAAPCAFFAELAARGILARKLYYYYYSRVLVVRIHTTSTRVCIASIHTLWILWIQVQQTYSTSQYIAEERLFPQTADAHLFFGFGAQCRNIMHDLAQVGYAF